MGIFDRTKLKEKVLMQREMLKSKIHRVTVTEAELYYEGSITVDKDLLEAADILPYEKVQVLNFNNGSRLDTYTIEGASGSGTICLNGPAARFGSVGDEVIIVSYVHLPEESAKKFKPKLVMVDKKNKITKVI
ncbi:MAG: aspartate 1-decarboxylase [Ignavibacteriaceae bacterium]|nr:aspartate 1-decarboxylase [Ignavibacteriaceae bacterium]